MCCFLGKNVHFQPFLGYFGGISYTNLVLNWLFKINPFLGYFGPIYASGRELCLRQAPNIYGQGPQGAYPAEQKLFLLGGFIFVYLGPPWGSPAPNKGP